MKVGLVSPRGTSTGGGQEVVLFSFLFPFLPNPKNPQSSSSVSANNEWQTVIINTKLIQSLCLKVFKSTNHLDECLSRHSSSSLWQTLTSFPKNKFPPQGTALSFIRLKFQGERPRRRQGRNTHDFHGLLPFLFKISTPFNQKKVKLEQKVDRPIRFFVFIDWKGDQIQ